MIYNLCQKTCQLAIQSIRLYLKDSDPSQRRQVENQFKREIKALEAEFGEFRPQLVHGGGTDSDRVSWAAEDWESMLFLGGDGLTSMEETRRDMADALLSNDAQRGIFQRRQSDTMSVWAALGENLERLELVLQEAV